MSIPDADDLLALPYAKRRTIVVVDDEAVADAQPPTRSTTPAWLDLAAPAVPAGGAAVQALKAALAARDEGLDVLPVAHSTADRLTFPPGHPRDRVLYVAHPVAPGTYFPAAQFHRLAFEHKFAEAVRLLMALGAAELVVEHETGWSRDFAAQLDARLPKGATAAAGATRRTDASSALFRARLDPSGEPHVPAELAWYPHEPAWQQLAEGRLRHGLRDFELTLRYEDDYGVDVALKAAAERVRLDLGGRFEDHRATAWAIRGRFA